MTNRTARIAALGLALLPAFAAPGAAQPAMSSMALAGSRPHVIQVNRCDPERTLRTSPAYGGFAPGFYPPGAPWYWGDVYGFNYYQPPATVTASGDLYLDYVNVSPKVMAEIEFGLVANGRLRAEVKDVGTFSPGAEIKHSFGLSPNVFPLRTALARCVPLRITFKDGTHWVNPRLPHLEATIYN